MEEEAEVSPALAFSLGPSWTFPEDHRFGGDWAPLGGGDSVGAVPEAGLGGGSGGAGREEGESGLESWAAVAVVWAAPTLPEDRGGWGSGLWSLAPSFERPGWGLAWVRGAVLGLGARRPFPWGEGGTLTPPSRG